MKCLYNGNILFSCQNHRRRQVNAYFKRTQTLAIANGNHIIRKVTIGKDGEAGWQL